MKRIDGIFSDAARALARRTSRRGFLGRLGAALLGGAALPLLPVVRAGANPRAPAPGEPSPDSEVGDPQQCGYWRYCAMDGFLAACCGGSHRSCPPGTEMSPVTWLGTYRNTADGEAGNCAVVSEGRQNSRCEAEQISDDANNN